jgi:hypothetical protein
MGKGEGERRKDGSRESEEDRLKKNNFLKCIKAVKKLPFSWVLVSYLIMIVDAFVARKI